MTQRALLPDAGPGLTNDLGLQRVAVPAHEVPLYQVYQSKADVHGGVEGRIADISSSGRSEIEQRFLSINIARQNQWKRGDEGVPNKPLLLLYALECFIRQGDKPIPYSEVDVELRRLLKVFRAIAGTWFSFRSISRASQVTAAFRNAVPPTHLAADAALVPLRLAAAGQFIARAALCALDSHLLHHLRFSFRASHSTAFYWPVVANWHRPQNRLRTE